MSRNASRKLKYVYELPYDIRSIICGILDETERWEELAGIYMEYDDLTIRHLRRARSPTDELLLKWGHSNGTICELFTLLSKMEHYECMNYLKPLVSSEYHYLIDNGEGHLGRNSSDDNENSDPKDLKIGAQNFNDIRPVQVNGPKVIVHRVDDEKILNRSPELSSLLVQSSSNMQASSSVQSSNVFQILQPIAGTLTTNNGLKFSSADTAWDQISYNELARITGGWNKYNILGKGDFGTVFAGTWKNRHVAIKRIEHHRPDAYESYLIQLQQSLRELESLNSYSNANVLLLYGYSMGPEAPCLVYEFMPNGSLKDRLFLKQQSEYLTWLQRHKIAKGTARGLQFLHTIGDQPLIHGNIKSSNILLDNNFEPKIGDFGLARVGLENDGMKVKRIHGTRPYLPDEFLYGRTLSTKVDMYSYGIVLFELATGLVAYDNARPKNKSLKEFIDNSDVEYLPFLKDGKAGTENKQVFENLIVLGKWCSNKLTNNRPEIVLVLRKIDELESPR